MESVVRALRACAWAMPLVIPIPQAWRVIQDDRDQTPQIEYRAVDFAKTVTCPNCSHDIETPFEEPWIISGGQQHAPMLVSFIRPYCQHQIEMGKS